MADFPASVHKGTYENSIIALDETHFLELLKEGWLLSESFLAKAKSLNDSDPVPAKRGRKKTEEVIEDSASVAEELIKE